MAYILTYSGNQTGGNRQISVPDNGTYQIGNVALPGRNYSGYGGPVDQNILSMVENFASSTVGPEMPVTGQLWYEVATTSLKVNTSTGNTAVWTSLALTGPNSVITTSNITTGSTSLPGTITGNWSLTAGSRLTSTYADLAERHHADRVYSVGTVITVGGNAEVTAAKEGATVLGVVSDQYAYLMNDHHDDEFNPAVAYVGRVPVKVLGPINKHDRIVATDGGVARAIADSTEQSFGWALETNTDAGEKLVLCIIK